MEVYITGMISWHPSAKTHIIQTDERNLDEMIGDGITLCGRKIYLNQIPAVVEFKLYEVDCKKCLIKWKEVSERWRK